MRGLPKGGPRCRIRCPLGKQPLKFSCRQLWLAEALHYANLAEGWFGMISYRLEGNRWVGEWAIYNTGNGLRGRETLTRR